MCLFPVLQVVFFYHIYVYVDVLHLLTVYRCGMFYLLAVYRCSMFYLLTVYRCGMLIPLFFCCSHPSVYLFFKKKFKSISASFSGKPKWIKSWSQCKFVFIFVKWFVRETPGVISLGAWNPLYPPLYLGVGANAYKLSKWEVRGGDSGPLKYPFCYTASQVTRRSYRSTMESGPPRDNMYVIRNWSGDSLLVSCVIPRLDQHTPIV